MAPNVPDPDGLQGKSHGGPGHNHRTGYMPLNNAMGDLPGGSHDKDADFPESPLPDKNASGY